MSFLDDVKEVLDNRKQLTENGAVGYATSGHALLDMNFAVTSYRNKQDFEIASDFSKAYFENPLMAVAWVFYARDVRGGLGERNLFRVCMKKLADINKSLFIELLPLVAEYGRWDDIFSWMTIDKDIEDAVLKLTKEQFDKDLIDRMDDKPISLLAKWIPTENCSNKDRKIKARKIIDFMDVKPSDYRKCVANLRKYLDVVEVKTSENKWDEIDYNTVPSCANLKYKDAFLKHDEKRRTKYLNALARGDKNVKINSSVLYPHDIVSKYTEHSYWGREVKGYDEAVEQLWKNLPNLVEGGNTLVVADGSASMLTTVGNTSVTALEVANALAIYFSEHNEGAFKDKYITFSARPQLVDFSNAKTLRDKIRIALTHNECSNTNIEKTFKLILTTAIENHYKQSDMPQNIVIISDMEFDCGITHDAYWFNGQEKTLFENLAKDFENAGYKMPKLIFWNVCGRTNTIPIKQNDAGVILMSGFSVNLCNMVFNNETDPYVALVKEITKERYHAVLKVANKVLQS